MAYRHGAYVTEKATALVSPANVESALPLFVGAAPVHNLPAGTAAPVNEPRLCHSLPDFTAAFGAPGEAENPEDYPLYQAAEVYFTRYRCAPAVFVNVFDPARHVKEIAAADGDEARTVPDVSQISDDEIIGGQDAKTLKRSGIALLDEVFPLFRLVPGLVLAPGRSKSPAVAIALAAAAASVSGFFRCMAICECPADLANHTLAPAWLADNNISDANLICIYGDCLYNGRTEPGSIHLAGAIGARDAENDGVPFWSPSNRQIMAEGMVLGGKKLALTPAEAAVLNGNGIVTGISMAGGLVVWGDQTSVWPGVTDVKDSSIPIRRMFNWIGNTLVLTSWQFVSCPVRRRMIETVQDTFNCWLNGLAGREYILGGRCTFETADNPKTDLMAGKVRWHIYVCPPQAAVEIEFILEYDPAYLETLFNNVTTGTSQETWLENAGGGNA